MKKSNSKTKSPAPATSATKSTKKKSTAKATPAAVPITSTPAASPAPVVPTPKPVATTPTIVSVSPSAEPPVVKAVAPAKVLTRIIARLDVGYGNALYVRGDGAGLTWEQGTPMECVAPDQWELTLGESARPISFKVLMNDHTWCTGPDSVVASGSTVTIAPEFP